MDIEFTVGNVRFTLTSSKSEECSSSEPPRVLMPESKDVEKLVELSHFSGILKIEKTAGVSSMPSFRPQAYSQQPPVYAAPPPPPASSRRRSLDIRGSGISSIGATRGSVGKSVSSKGGGLPSINEKKVSDVSKPNSIEQMKTPLHISCASLTPNVEEMTTIFNSNPSAVFIPDKEQRLPLHHLARNDRLLQTGNDKAKIDNFVTKLLTAYPESITLKDSTGRIPFTESLAKWIDAEHTRSNEEIIVVSEFMQGLHNFNRIIPTCVEVPPLADWGITMLSTIMDTTDAKTRNEIVQNVADIPFLLKILLLIESDDDRSKVISSSLFKRIILEPRTVGLWIIPLLKAGTIYSSRCVDYFEIVSDSTVRYYIGKQRTANPSDNAAFLESRTQVFEKVGRSHLLLPCLCQLPKFERERAGCSKIVKEIIDFKINDNFVRCMFLNDVFMLISLMILFRVTCFNNGVMVTVPVTREFYNDGKLFNETQYELLAMVSVCCYFVTRFVSQAVGMVAISPKVMRRVAYQRWLTSIIAIIITCVSIALLWYGFYDSDWMAFLLAWTMGLQWLSFFDYLTALIKPLAAFRAATGELVKNLLWFGLLFASMVMMFADIFHIYNTNSGECSLSHDGGAETFGRSLGTGGYGDIVTTSYSVQDIKMEDLMLNYNEEDAYCSSEITRSYGALYSVALGQYDEEKIQRDQFSVFIFVLYTSIVVILLLTCYIALVIECYEQVKDKGEKIIGIQRIDFATEQVQLKNTILGKKLVKSGTQSWASWKSKMNFVYNWGVLIFSVGTTIAMCYFNSKILFAYEDGIEYYSMFHRKAVRIMFTVVQAIVLGINQLCIFDYLLQFYIEEGGFVWRCRKFVHEIILRIFPIDVRQITRGIINLDGLTEDWTGRLISFERATNQIVMESEKRISKLVRHSEERILESEMDIKYDLLTVIENSAIKKKKRSSDSDDSDYSDSDDSTQYDFTRKKLNLRMSR